MTPARRVIDALEHHGCTVREQRGGWVATCPAHEDRHPSLRVTEGDDGRALLVCRAGCDTGDVLAQLGLTWSDLYPEGRR